MRTGSVVNRNADDMLKTLVEPKKKVISEIRHRLLNLGFLEEVEYDAINIEPVLIYLKSEKKLVFLKHKWELLAMIPLKSEQYPEGVDLPQAGDAYTQFQYSDEEGNRWLRFSLPNEEDNLFLTLDNL